MHPRQSIVTARDGNRLRLIAYVLYEQERISRRERYLRHRLPDYMVPSVFVAMERIPLTPNGKVDLRSLPDPFKRAMRATGSYERPAPGTEELLAGIWRICFGSNGLAPPIASLNWAVSLLSLRMVAAIRAQTGCDMQPRALFFQSLREVAAGFAARCKEPERKCDDTLLLVCANVVCSASTIEPARTSSAHAAVLCNLGPTGHFCASYRSLRQLALTFMTIAWFSHPSFRLLKARVIRRVT